MEQSYIEAGEQAQWWQQYERPLEEAMAGSDPGSAPVFFVFCMSPHSDFAQASTGVGRVFRVIRVQFLCFPSCLWERSQRPARLWRWLYKRPRRQGPEHHAVGAEDVSGCSED